MTDSLSVSLDRQRICPWHFFGLSFCLPSHGLWESVNTLLLRTPEWLVPSLLDTEASSVRRLGKCVTRSGCSKRRNQEWTALFSLHCNWPFARLARLPLALRGAPAPYTAPLAQDRSRPRKEDRVKTPSSATKRTRVVIGWSPLTPWRPRPQTVGILPQSSLLILASHN